MRRRALLLLLVLATAAAGQDKAPPDKAVLKVRLPADARLTIDGEATTPTGPVRTFVSDAMRPGAHYEYELKATWEEKGQKRSAVRKVTVTPGLVFDVDLTGVATAVLTSEDATLWRRASPGQPWHVVKQKEELTTGDQFVSGTGAVLVGQNGAVRLEVVGDLNRDSPFPILETGFSLNQPAEGVDLDVSLERGRIELTNLKKEGPATVRVRVRGHPNEAVLKTPGTRVAIELYGRWLRDQPFVKDPKPDDPGPSLAVVVLVLQGEVYAKGIRRDFTLSAPPGPALLLGDVTRGAAEPQHLEKLPDWVTEKDNEKARAIRAMLARFRTLSIEKGVPAAVEAFLTSPNVPEQRFGIVLAGAFDELPRVAGLMAVTKDREIWEQAVVVIRHWIGRGPGQDQKLYKALIERKFDPHEAEIVMHLLHGIPEDDLALPETYQVLLKYMASDRLFLRGLAHWHLCCLASQGREFGFNPNGPPEERAKALEKWRQLIPPGQLPPKPKIDEK
jgi:uncharacterized protein (TIGR03000 family)